MPAVVTRDCFCRCTGFRLVFRHDAIRHARLDQVRNCLHPKAVWDRIVAALTGEGVEFTAATESSGEGVRYIEPRNGGRLDDVKNVVV